MDEVEDEVVEPEFKTTLKEDQVYYSQSKLRNQSKCPAINYFVDLERRGLLPGPTDPAYPLVFGSAAHKGIEMRLKYGDDSKRVAKEYIQEHLLDKYEASQLDRKKIADKLDHIDLCLDHFESELYGSLMDSMKDPEHEVEVTIRAPFRKGILVGVVDIMRIDEGIWSDWKTSARVPSDEDIRRDKQSAIYYWIAKACGLPVPKVFNYVYLKGMNMNFKQEIYKSGKRKGEAHSVPDEDNPRWKLTYPVFQDDARIERVMQNYVMPLAQQYEQKVYYKVESDYNCSNCQFKTVCKETDLPKQEDY